MDYSPLYGYYIAPSTEAKLNSNSVVGVIDNVKDKASPTANSPKPTEISPSNEIINPSGKVISTVLACPSSAISRNFLYSGPS